jgi:hypothetical protein
LHQKDFVKKLFILELTLALGHRADNMPAITRSKAKILLLGTPLVEDTEFPKIDGFELKELLRDRHDSTHDSPYIIDCRSSSEYAGGHIRWAKNRSTFEGVQQLLHNNPPSDLIVLHCEYSERRAPKM